MVPVIVEVVINRHYDSYTNYGGLITFSIRNRRKAMNNYSPEIFYSDLNVVVWKGYIVMFINE